MIEVLTFGGWFAAGQGSAKGIKCLEFEASTIPRRRNPFHLAQTEIELCHQGCAATRFLGGSCSNQIEQKRFRKAQEINLVLPLIEM